MSFPLGNKQNIKIFVLYLMQNVGYPMDFVTVNDIIMQTDYVAKPCSPLPRQTEGSPGISSMPVISFTFFGIFSLIYPPLTYKKVRNRSHAPEKAQAPIAAKQTFDKQENIHIHKDGTCTFFQIQIFVDAKRQSIPIQKNTPKCHIQFVSQIHYITIFTVCKYVQ